MFPPIAKKKESFLFFGNRRTTGVLAALPRSMAFRMAGIGHPASIGDRAGSVSISVIPAKILLDFSRRLSLSTRNVYMIYDRAA